MALAAQPLYVRDSATDALRLVAAPGDVVPTGLELRDADGTVLGAGVTTALPTGALGQRPDPITTVLVPVEGYDALSEAEVLDLLPGLSADELAAVQDYERAHRARGAITRWGHRSEVVGAVPPHSVPARSASEGYDPSDLPALRAELDRRGVRYAVNANGARLVRLLQDDDAASGAPDVTTTTTTT